MCGSIQSRICTRPLKTQEMCDEAVRRKPYTLRYVPDHFSDRFKTEEMCNKAVRRKPYSLRYVHGSCLLRYVPDHLKTQEAFGRVAEKIV